MNNNGRATKQLCNVYYTGSGGKKPFYAQFDVSVALSRYIMVTLSVGFQCPDSKDSRIVCLHIQNIDM